jgi:hypothetical protein
MKQIVAAALAISLFTACGGNQSDANYTPTPSVIVGDTQSQKQKEGAAQLLPATSANPQAVVPVGAQPQATAAMPVNATAAGLNPPHGQPGHRCDIPDGAPLNSAPATATAQPVAQATAPQPITIKQNAPTMVPAQAAPTAKGMNPAHGQPGHRCDIAVGAPLNSKPTVQPSTAKAVTTTPTIQPNIAQQPAVVTPVAPGMNPQHGQPGHRCDIAVGAPLNSAPAKKDSAR